MIGKAALYGLGAGGEAGVSRVLAILRQEFDVAMALSGNQRAAAVRPDTLQR
jgi:L-lactate dehydrogenase (FMN-dependent) and related alpha-hydroxy acid dehydrogenases